MKSNLNLFEASAQWRSRPQDERFETLADLKAAVHSRRMCSRAVDLNLGSIEVQADPVNENGIVINSAIAPSRPSNWAFGQLASWVKAPAAYLRTLPTDLAVKALNHGLAKWGESDQKFMTLANPEGGINTLQAVTSTTYGRIWDADCVAAIERIVERSGGRFHNPLAIDLNGGAPKPSGLYASDRDVFAFMIDGGSLLEAGPRAKINRGFFVTNSEVGRSTFTLTTFLFNVVCGNHIVWGASDVKTLKIRHTSGGPARFDAEALPALLDYANASAAPIESTIQRAMAWSLPKEADDLQKLATRFSITRGELTQARAFAQVEEGQFGSLWDLVQGLTAYARGFDFADARIDLETRAGNLLKMVETN